jgi:hypothetical protein
MSVYNDPVSTASALPELWIAPVAFHENVREATIEGVAAVRNEVEGRYP